MARAQFHLPKFLKASSYVYGEYALNFNSYQAGQPMPQKLEGIIIKPNGLMQIRPAHRLVADMDNAGEIIDVEYISVFGWVVVATYESGVTTLKVFDDNDHTKSNVTLATFTVSGTPAPANIQLLSLNTAGLLTADLAGVYKDIIFVAGIGVNLKYIGKSTTTNLPVLNDFKINKSGTSNTNTPVVRAIGYMVARFFMICDAPLAGTAIADHQYVYCSTEFKYNDFVSTVDATSSFQLYFQLYAGEQLYAMVPERKQMIVITSHGLSVFKAKDLTNSISPTNYEYWPIDKSVAQKIPPVIFANYAIYASDDGLRVRAYAQFAALYSPQMEPACIPLPGMMPAINKEIKRIKNVNKPETMYVISEDVCYVIAHPRSVHTEQMLPVASLYPRTTYIDHDQLKVKAVSQEIPYMIFEKDDGTRMVTAPDYSMGLLSIGSRYYYPKLKITAISNGIITIKSESGTEDLLGTADLKRFYLNVTGTWVLYYNYSGNQYKTTHVGNAPIQDTVYEFLPTECYDMEKILSPIVDGNHDWSYTGFVDGVKYIAMASGSGKSMFVIPEPEETSLIEKWILHMYKGDSELVFEADTPPTMNAIVSDLVIVFDGKVEGLLNLSPKPQQEIGSSSSSERVLSLLNIPAYFSTTNNTTSITISPDYHGVNDEAEDLTIVRFMAA